MVLNHLPVVLGTDILNQFIRPNTPIQSNGNYHYVEERASRLV